MEKFEEAWKENRHVWESTKNLAKAMYLAGEEAQQAKLEELQKRVDEQAKEINFLNNRADDLALDQMKTAQFNYQLEQKINDLQAQLDEVNASNLRRSVHIDRLQKHNLKLQQRLKENGLEWKDLIEEQALKGGQV